MPKKFYCKNQKKIPDRVVRRATINLKRVALIFVENFYKKTVLNYFCTFTEIREIMGKTELNFRELEEGVC
jgi:hypothetical protein